MLLHSDSLSIIPPSLSPLLRKYFTRVWWCVCDRVGNNNEQVTAYTAHAHMHADVSPHVLSHPQDCSPAPLLAMHWNNGMVGNQQVLPSYLQHVLCHTTFEHIQQY